MWSTSFIRRHICRLKDNEMFCNRDLLTYGQRALVDTVLHKMHKAGSIIRIARGVYVKYSTNFQRPSIIEIARFKAKAFGRSLVAQMEDAAKSLGLAQEGSKRTMFMSDGPTTSFITTCGTRIYLQKAAPRKIRLDDNLVETAIKAFWHCGQPMTHDRLSHVTNQWGKTARQLLRNNAAWMPAWIADVVTRFILYSSP